ncbi:MAG: helix-turn-helix domain-containing protein [archaeon]
MLYGFNNDKAKTVLLSPLEVICKALGCYVMVTK